VPWVCLDCAGRRDSAKVRRASQSSVVHPSRLSVSSLGQIQVVVVVGAERLCQGEDRTRATAAARATVSPDLSRN
jgi:hypothetical protein